MRHEYDGFYNLGFRIPLPWASWAVIARRLLGLKLGDLPTAVPQGSSVMGRSRLPGTRKPVSWEGICCKFNISVELSAIVPGPQTSWISVSVLSYSIASVSPPCCASSTVRSRYSQRYQFPWESQRHYLAVSNIHWSLPFPVKCVWKPKTRAREPNLSFNETNDCGSTTVRNVTFRNLSRFVIGTANLFGKQLDHQQ